MIVNTRVIAVLIIGITGIVCVHGFRDLKLRDLVDMWVMLELISRTCKKP